MVTQPGQQEDEPKGQEERRGPERGDLEDLPGGQQHAQGDQEDAEKREAAAAI